uniref:Uncharacterized protein n=1 Tax=Caenorhabditis japonica TaxID=281687 RepID=A0A8R1DIU5_CAEJA
MAPTPLKKQRRATILVTGPQSKTRIYDEEIGQEKSMQQATLQDLTMARQRLQNEMAVVNTASGIEILAQIVMDEFEIMRMRLRENGERMRHFFRDRLGGSQIRAILIRIFSKSMNSRNMLQYRNDAKEVLNEICSLDENCYKIPRYTLNDIEEVLLTDDLEDGVIQRRSEKWTSLPIRQKVLDEEEDVFCEFRKLNVPMPMTFEDDDEDRFSMPSTRTQLTAEDQMASIQNQLAMLSKQLMSLQQGGTLKSDRSSRASSRRGGKKIEKVGNFS